MHATRLRFAAIQLIAFALIALAALQSSHAQPAAPATPPASTHPSTDRRVLLISVDGLRPDVLLRANTPNFRALMREGSFTFYAQTTPLANTMPSHTSMITGLTPARHGLTWNGDPPLTDAVKLAAPTLFNLARDAGISSALVSGKAKFALFCRGGVPTWSDVTPVATLDDAGVADKAVALIKAHRPQFLMVHLPNVDTVGHATGWGTPEQIAAVEKADAAVGRMLEAIGPDRAKTLVIVTADHGGAGRGHVPDDFRAKFIPWIAAGPGVRKNHDLTLDSELTLRTEDTFATICDFLHLATPAAIDGKLVQQAFAPKPLVAVAATQPAAAK